MKSGILTLDSLSGAAKTSHALALSVEMWLLVVLALCAAARAGFEEERDLEILSLKPSGQPRRIIEVRARNES